MDEGIRVHRSVQVVGLVLIMAFSLALLAYVGYGEAWRTYPRFEIERLAAQGQTVQTAIDPFLQAGLPLSEFPGFVPLTRPLLESDPSIGAIAVVDLRGKVLFANQQPGSGDFQVGEFHPSALQGKASHFQVGEGETAYRVSLELRNKIEPVGTLVLYMPRHVVAEEISSVFVPRVVLGALVLLLLFAVVAAFLTVRASEHVKRVRAVAYGIVFMLMAVVVVTSLIEVYSDGIRNKTKALADSLSERLEAPLALGLRLDDFSELDTVFADYKKLYPDLSYVALTQDDQILIDTDAARVGRTWAASTGHYEYAAPILSSALAGAHLAVRAGIPEGVIYDQLWRSAKNFFVLFMASGFLAMIFFDLLYTFTALPTRGRTRSEVRRTFQENVILPILFFTIFIEALSTSFMPQYLSQLARANGADPGTVSAQFTVYYAALAIALLPVGRFIDSGKMKWVLLLSIVLEIVSLALMASMSSSFLMFPVRALAGAAHGIMATGAQAYLLLLASRTRMTHGASRFLFTYNSGMIAGTAIGGLLAVYIGFSGVFALATVLVVPVLVFAMRVLPKSLDPEDTDAVPGAVQPPFLPSLGRAVSDPTFASAVMFVGIPAKVVNAGVIAFALPLLLAHQAVPQEDIGQFMMFYPIGILLMSLIVARVVDSLGSPRIALLIGTGVGAAAVVLVGLMVAGIANAANGTALLLIAGLLVLGLAHGMINAPIVTYVVGSPVADRLGRSTVSSVYRFVERTGHMVGPIVISQLLIVGQPSNSAVAWIAVPILLLGLLFWVVSERRPAPRLAPSSAT